MTAARIARAEPPHARCVLCVPNAPFNVCIGERLKKMGIYVKDIIHDLQLLIINYDTVTIIIMITAYIYLILYLTIIP